MTTVHIFYLHVNSKSLDPAKRPPWPAERPPWFDMEVCFYNLLSTISDNNKSAIEFKLNIMFDGNQTTFEQDFMSTFFTQISAKFNFDIKLVMFNGGSNPKSFSYVINYVVAQNYLSDDWIYLLEDDYLHVADWVEKFEALIHCSSFDNTKDDFYKPTMNYITLYDHGDKYFHHNYADLASKIYFVKNHHWRTTPSTCNSYLLKYQVLLEDMQEMIKADCYDYYYFRELKEKKARTVVSPIPGLSTHCSQRFISPGINWEKVNANAISYRNLLLAP